jgi:ribosomal-protein-alanine N-acetyltransferase
MSRAAHLLSAAAHHGRVELRRMRWWDIPGVILLEHAAFPDDAWSVGMFWSELAEAATRYYLVAEEFDPTGEDSRLIGYAGLLAGAGEAEVLTIAVDPAHEGRGLGAVLLTELMRDAARRDCDDVVLEVRVDNDRAQQLYYRFGFEGVGIRKGYYQPMNIDALVMRSSDVIARFGSESGRESTGDQDNGARSTGKHSLQSVDSVDWVRE